MQVLATPASEFFSGAGSFRLKPGNRNQNFSLTHLFLRRQLDNVAHRFLQWPRSGPSLIFSLPVLADFYEQVSDADHLRWLRSWWRLTTSTGTFTPAHPLQRCIGNDAFAMLPVIAELFMMRRQCSIMRDGPMAIAYCDL